MTNFKHIIKKAISDNRNKITFEVHSRKEHVQLCQSSFDLGLLTSCGQLPDKDKDGYSKGFEVTVDLNSKEEVKEFLEMFNYKEA